MKNKDLFGILEGIKLCADLRGVKFAYVLSKNKAHLISEIKHIQKGLKPPKEYDLFENKRLELCTKFSKKDAKNKPLVVEGAYNIEDQEKFDIELENLKNEYKDTVDKRTKQIEDYNKLLEEPSNIDLHKIFVEHLPDDITVKQMDMIIEMIEEKG